MGGTVEIKVHLKGYFKCSNKVSYEDGRCAIIKGWDPSVLNFQNLHDIHSQAGGDKGPVRFFFGSKSGIETGVSEILSDDDVKVWLYLFEGAPFLEIYAAKTEPPEFVSCTGNVLVGGIDITIEEQVSYEGDHMVEDDECESESEPENEVGDGNAGQDVGVEENDGEGRLDVHDEFWEELEDITRVHASEESWFREDVNEKELLDSSERIHPDFNVETKLQQQKIELAVGHTFGTAQEFRDVLKDWSVKEGFAFKYVKNEKSRVTAVCAQEGCPWRIHASPVQGEETFRIKTLKGDHACGRQYINKHCNSTYLCAKYAEKIRDDPKKSVVALQKDVKRDLGVEISKRQAYRAKRKALQLSEADQVRQFNRLWDYCATIRKYNPGSTIRIKLHDTQIQETRDGTPMIPVDEGRIFQRMYYCLAASKRGFLIGCRPVIGLDGCFLKGTYGGQLLTAMGRDGNNNMFPIAFCVAEAEKYESWKWFLDNLVDDLGGSGGRNWTFISDRQKGLVNAVSEVFPESEHRYCIRHMYDNFKKKYPGKRFMDLFWKAASASHPAYYQRAMEELHEANPSVDGKENAASWLEKTPKEQWCKAFFSTRSKCDILVNNLSESFNNSITTGREMSIVSLMDFIRRMLMRLFSARSKFIQGYTGAFCPLVHQKIENLKKLSNHCFPEYSDGRKFGVQCGNKDYVVDLEMKTCTCRMFELTGIPCHHAIAAIQFDRGDIEKYVDDAYKRETCMLAYSFSVYPVPSIDFWEDTGLGGICPPFVRKQPGRPKKLRKRAADEPRPAGKSTRKGLRVRCKQCKQLGHNKRTCQRSCPSSVAFPYSLDASSQVINPSDVHCINTVGVANLTPSQSSGRQKEPVRRRVSSPRHHDKGGSTVAVNQPKRNPMNKHTEASDLPRRSPRHKHTESSTVPRRSPRTKEKLQFS